MSQHTYMLNKGFIYQELEKDIVIFDAENSALFTFNESSALIFQGIHKGESEEDIVKKLTDMYEVSPDQALKDIKRIIALLQKKKVIVRRLKRKFSSKS